MKLLTSLSFLLLCCCLVSAQGIQFEQGTWSEVKKKASKEDKLIFVDSYTTWCGPCKWMAKNVFTDEKVGDVYNAQFVNYKLDMEKGEGVEFARHYEVRAYPTLLFINGEGDVVHKQMGALPAEKFLELAKTAYDPDQQISALAKKYRKGVRDSEFLRTYLTGLLYAGMEPGEVSDEYFRSLSAADMVSKENYRLLTMMEPPMSSPQFAMLMDNKDAFVSEVGSDEFNGFLKKSCQRELMVMAYKGDYGAFKKSVKLIESYDMEFADEVVTVGQMHYGQRNQDYDLFMTSGKRYLKKYSDNDWSGLNTVAWDIYEDENYASKSYIKLGQKMAKKSIKLDQNYYNTDTYAALLYKAGNYKKALEWADIAMEEAKAEGEDPVETKKLLKKIKKKMELPVM